MSKKTYFSIVTIIGSIILSLLGGEIICQTVYLSKLRFWGEFVPDKQLAWIPRANTSFEVEWYKGIKQKVSTNKYGLRESSNPEDLKAKSSVILLQGDSQLFGYGIQPEELVSTQLKNLFANRKDMEVINAGCSGYDLQHYVLQIEKLYPVYRPRYIFVMFYMGNDHLSSVMSTAFLVSRPYYDLEGDQLVFKKAEYRVPGQLYAPKFVDSLSQNDHLLDAYMSRKKPRLYIKGFWGNSFLAYEIFTRIWGTSLGKRFIDLDKKKNWSEEEWNRARLVLNYGTYLSKWPEPYDSSKELITRLFEKYRHFTESKTVVVILPEKTEIINPEKIENEIRTLSGKKEMTIDLNKPINVLKSILDEVKIDYIDLREICLIERDKEELFLEDNPHISPKFHKLIAERIFYYIQGDLH